MAVTIEVDIAPSGADAAPRRSGRALLAVWLTVTVVLVGCLVFVPAADREPGGGTTRVAARWLLEPWLAVGILCWALRHQGIRRILPPAQRALFGALVVGCLAVQSLPMLDAYPLTDWSMYSSPTDSMRYMELRMVDEQGQSVGDLPIADLVPNTLGRGFMERLSEWVERAEGGDAHAREVVERTLLGLIHDTGDATVLGVDARWCRVERPTAEQPARCETAVSVRR